MTNLVTNDEIEISAPRFLPTGKVDLQAAETEFEKKIPDSKHIFEDCYRNPEVRRLFRRNNLFCQLRDDEGEPPINTSYENLKLHLDTYHEIERFGVENKMALRGARREDIFQSQAFRATYANMIADRIYDVVPYGRIYFHLIMAYYAVTKLNFDRFARWQLCSFVGVIASSALAFAVFIPDGEINKIHYTILSVVLLGITALFWVFNNIIHGFYKNVVAVNMTTISDKIRERIFHLITAEQTCFSRITTEENSAGTDAAWKERATVWAIAAVAFRWRVFLLKQFLDVGMHKTVRHYVWVHNFKGRSTILAFAILFLSLGTTALGYGPDIAGWPLPRHLAGYVAATMALPALLMFFLWSANPADELNQIAARIGAADAGIDVDTPRDVIIHLVGRISTAKNEGRRN